MSTKRNKLNAQAVNAASKVYNSLSAGRIDPGSISACPLDISDTKARYYGTAAWMIDQTLAEVFTSIGKRGEYGLLTPQDSTVPIEAVKNFQDMQDFMHATIMKTYDRLFAKLSETGYPDESHYVYRSLAAYIENSILYDESNNNFHYGSRRLVSAGIVTATQIIGMVLAQMATSPLMRSTDKEHLLKSMQPVLRIAKVHVNDLREIQDTLLKSDSSEKYVLLPNGRIDFNLTIQDGLQVFADQRSEDASPTLGCPVLLKPKQLQELWQWGVNIALTAGLITPSDYHTEH